MSSMQEKLLEQMQLSQLTYADLEKMTGISDSTIQRYFTGKTKKIPINNLLSITEALNIDLAYLEGKFDHLPMNIVENHIKQSKKEYCEWEQKKENKRLESLRNQHLPYRFRYILEMYNECDEEAKKEIMTFLKFQLEQTKQRAKDKNKPKKDK